MSNETKNEAQSQVQPSQAPATAESSSMPAALTDKDGNLVNQLDSLAAAPNPRDLLKQEGFLHIGLRDGGGYEVYEKQSFGGKMVEVVMIRYDFKTLADGESLFPNGTRGPVEGDITPKA